MKDTISAVDDARRSYAVSPSETSLDRIRRMMMVNTFPYQALWRTYDMVWPDGEINVPVLVLGPPTERHEGKSVPICYRNSSTGKFEETYARLADLVGAE